MHQWVARSAPPRTADTKVPSRASRRAAAAAGLRSDQGAMREGAGLKAPRRRVAKTDPREIMQSMSPRPSPRDLRASDADRDRVLALLGEAMSDGRLSQEEHAERVQRAFSARTLGELAELTAD